MAEALEAADTATAAATSEEAVGSVAETTSAETENTETATDTKTEDTGSKTVPYGRFREVNEKAKANAAKAAQLEAELAELRKTQVKPAPAEEYKPQEMEAAPAELSELQRVDWYVRKGVERHFPDLVKKAFGMEPEEIRTLLGTQRETSKDYAERTWTTLCGEVGLDPKDRTIREITGGLVGRGKSIPEALKLVASFTKAKPVAKATGKTVTPAESNGVTDVMTAETVLTFDKKQAAELARQGKRVAHKTIEEILAESKARTKR